VGHSGHGQLSYVLSEAQQVAELLGAAPLLEDQATRAAVQAAAAASSVVHLATHGHFRADSPLFSTLQLADGVVTAEAPTTSQHLPGRPYLDKHAPPLSISPFLPSHPIMWT